LLVPIAVPELPVLVDQVTAVTPTLSLAVPVNIMDAEVVEIVAAEGDAMVNVGGVVSGGPAAACRTTTTDLMTRLEPDAAVTVIVLEPVASGIFKMLQDDAGP